MLGDVRQATATGHRNPLLPTEPPADVWTDLASIHWGPTQATPTCLL